MSYTRKNEWGTIFHYKTKEGADKGFGPLHREDGPAIELADGYKTWYIDGEPLTKQEFEAYRMRKAVRGWL